jgi:hypothetical protein
MIFSRHFYVISVIFFALSSSAVADLVLPSDLNPGDQYRLVFVSDASTAASSSDITFYNQFVNSAANAPTTDTAPLSLSWTAIASTDSIDAQDNTGTNPTVSSGVPIYRLDGVRIADDYVDLWKATIQNPIRVTESGTTITNSGVWTGSATDGTADSLYPLDGTGGSYGLARRHSRTIIGLQVVEIRHLSNFGFTDFRKRSPFQSLNPRRSFF